MLPYLIVRCNRLWVGFILKTDSWLILDYIELRTCASAHHLSASDSLRLWRYINLLTYLVSFLPGTNCTNCTRCGLVAEWLASQACDQQVAGSNPSRCAAEWNSGQVVYTHMPLLPGSVFWYQPMGGDARQLGRQPRAWQPTAWFMALVT